MKPENFNPKSPEFKINLHVHTLISDGKMAVESFFQQAKEFGKKKGEFITSITDHDRTKGTADAIRYMAEHHKELKNVRFAPGVEIFAKCESSKNSYKPNQIELLNYCINPFEKDGITSFLTKNTQKHKKLVKDIIVDAKEKYGVDVSDFEAYKQTKVPLRLYFSGDLRNPLDIYLKGKGLNEKQTDALFKGRITKENVTKYMPSVAEIFKFKKDSALSIAHPSRKCPQEYDHLREFFGDFKKMGGEAAESHYQCEFEDIKKYAPAWQNKENFNERKGQIYKLAKEAGLLSSGGIDNHGLSLTARK